MRMEKIVSIIFVLYFCHICKGAEPNYCEATPSQCFIDYDKIVNYLKSKITDVPKVVVILGSGLAEIANSAEDSVQIPYSDIPDFPLQPTEGQKAMLVVGKLSGQTLMFFQGRFQYLDGYDHSEIILPIRVSFLLGVTYFIVTNAAGSLNSSFKRGDIVVLKDHLNIPGVGPLRGPNDDRFGPRFVSLTNMYDSNLRKLALEIAKSQHLENDMHEGVYAYQLGPAYQTVAEAKMMKMLGADCVGMSTVPEVIAARQSNLTTVGFSVIANNIDMDYEDWHDLNQAEVISAVEKSLKKLALIITKLVAHMK